jgi:hypothetical protein
MGQQSRHGGNRIRKLYPNRNSKNVPVHKKVYGIAYDRLKQEANPAYKKVQAFPTIISLPLESIKHSQVIIIPWAGGLLHLPED